MDNFSGILKDNLHKRYKHALKELPQMQ